MSVSIQPTPQTGAATRRPFRFATSAACPLPGLLPPFFLKKEPKRAGRRRPRRKFSSRPLGRRLLGARNGSREKVLAEKGIIFALVAQIIMHRVLC